MAACRALAAALWLSVSCLPAVTQAPPPPLRTASEEAVCSEAGVCSGDGLGLLQHAARPHARPRAEAADLGNSSHESSSSEQPDAPRTASVADRSLLSTRGSEQPQMENVLSAFEALDGSSAQIQRVYTGRSFPKGYNKGYMPYSEHFQGIVRQQDQHYLFISGSGETENMGQVFVAELSSLPSSGAMGSNTVNKWGGPRQPSWGDSVKDVIQVDGEFWHSGGMSSFGDYLVVGAEAGCSTTDRILGGCTSQSRVHFYNTANPVSPKKLPYIVDRPTASAGACALTQQEDGRFLLMVGREDSAILDFYLSSGTSLETDPGFKLVNTWYKDSLLAAPGQWADFGQYQNLNFVRQKGGKLFMIGTYRTMNGLGDDTTDLYEVDARAPQHISITKVSSKHMSCLSGTCNFQAGGGAYVDSETRLLIYATNWEPKSGAITVNEFGGKPQGWGR